MREKQNHSIIAKIKDYIWQTRWGILLAGGMAFMAHGSILFSQRFGIDTDLIMNGQHNFYLIGRQGLVWLGKLLGLEWFNLYYAQVLTFLFVVLAPISFSFLFYHVYGQAERLKLSLFVLSVSFVISPFWAAQIYFMNQSAQVLFACILTAAALLLVETARITVSYRLLPAILAVVLMNMIFSCYQVLTVVYITGAAVIFILDSLKEERGVKRQLQWIGFHAGCFLAGFFSYLTISKLFFLEGSDYLTGQIGWGQVSVSEGIKRCVTAILITLGNHPPYYSGAYGIYALFLLTVTIYHLKAVGRLLRPDSVLILLAECFLFCTPYFFILIYGGGLLDRMQLVMPLSQGSMLYLTIVLFPRKTMWKGVCSRNAAVAAGLALGLVLVRDIRFQVNYCNRFYYTDEWVFQYDVQMAQKTYMDILAVKAAEDLSDSFDNYVFLGCPEIPYNKVAIQGNTLGWSCFRYDNTFMSRDRILLLMYNLGYPLQAHFTESEQADFFAYFEDCFSEIMDEMPAYPEPGYVKYLTNEKLGLEYMIIKLGEDWRL